MALARIITRSDQCSRQLAFDLLARGYTVEIVSPDKIPDNIADLELRVDTGPGDRLAATVEAHNGGSSASLEFVHYLKAPMGDFIRRPPEPPEVVRVPEPTACVVVGLSPAGTGQDPVTTRTRVNAEPGIESVGLPADVPQLAHEIVVPPASIPLAREVDPEGARLIVPPDPVPTPPAEPPGYFAVEDSTVVQPAIARPTMPRPLKSLRWRVGSAAWRWRAALMFAGVVLLAAVLGFGYRTGKAAAQGSGVVPVEKVATASTEMYFPGAADSDKDAGKEPRQVPALASSPSAVKSGRKSGHAPKGVPVPKATAATASHLARSLRTPGDDLIARNTVTYLDKRFEPRPVKKSAAKVTTAKSPARRGPSSRKHGGVIAANEVTYLHKPSAKAAK